MTPELLQGALEPEAAKLGMKIVRVVDTGFSFKIYARLLRPTVTHEIDAEMFVVSKPAPLADLMLSVLEQLQLRAHDEARESMDKLDVRRRVVQLSKEERRTLMEMLADAELEALSRFRHDAPQTAREQPSKIERYRALVGKLMR